MSHDADQSRETRSPSPAKLYRNTENGLMFGICAGIADYFGIAAWMVRVLAVLGLFMFTMPVVIAYFVAAFLVPRKPDELRLSEPEEQFWRGVRTQPRNTARDIRHRFRELERRLRQIEAHVTSREFQLARDIDNLER